MASVSGASGGDPIADAFPAMKAFFRSEEGRAALSRTGDAATVKLLDAGGKGDVFYIHARDRSASFVPVVSDEYWRAIFNVNGRIVSASVMALRDRSMSSDAARLLLDGFVSRIKAANAPKG